MKTIIAKNRSLKPASEEPDFTPQQMSAYYLDLESTVERIERATLYYQVLGLDRSATLEQLNSAYQQVIAVLYPPYKISAALPEEAIVRMAQAFEKASRAFSVLAAFAKRVEYDSVIAEKIDRTPSRATRQAARATDQAILRDPDRSSSSSGANRRRNERFKLTLPARITGHEREKGKWHEMTETIDVSRSGATFKLRKKVQQGLVLYITVPMPEKLRLHSHTSPTYSAYALVRRVSRVRGETRTIGVEFLGEHPPPGYLEKPWSLFKTKTWTGSDRRRKAREERAEVVGIEYFDSSMKLIAKETGRSENISSGGMRALVRQIPSEFEIVRVNCPAHGFESFALVTNRFLGRDGFERLCLVFIDNQWSL